MSYTHVLRRTSLSILVTGALSLMSFCAVAGPVAADEMDSSLSTVMPAGKMGVSYQREFVLNGATPPNTWQVSSGSLPSGLALDSSTGRLSGVPMVAGTSTFFLMGTDSLGQFALHGYTLYIQPATSFAILAPATLPEAKAGIEYRYDLNGGQAVMGKWSLVAGGLPVGLRLTSDGVLVGRPETASSWMFTAQVVGGSPIVSLQKQFQLSVVASTVSSPAVASRGPSSIVSASWSTAAPSMNRAALLQNLTTVGVMPGDLVRVVFDPSGVNTNIIYYIGADGLRHSFLSDQVFQSWYKNSDAVRIVSPDTLARIPLGTPVTYRPGSRVVKFHSVPALYVPQGSGVLQSLTGERAAEAMYGKDWALQTDTLSDSYVSAYQISSDRPLSSQADYNPSSLLSAYTTPGDLLSMR